MKICFFGVGGVGGYLGAIIANQYREEHEIYFVARGSHKEAICNNGLTLKKGGNEVINVRPKICTDKAVDLPVCDVIVLSVKSYDITDAIVELSGLVTDTTVVIPLLNGVDIYERIRSQLSAGIVLPSCIYVGTHIESPGVIYQKGGSCKIVTGKDPRRADYNLEKVLELFKGASVEISLEKDVNVSIWTKFLFIAAYGLVATVHGRTLGQILENEESSHDVKGIMQEVERIAKKLNVALDSNVVEDSYIKAKQFPYETKTSFQRDVELKGAKNEGDLFGGAILRFGKNLNIPTPVTGRIYGQLIRKLESSIV